MESPDNTENNLNLSLDSEFFCESLSERQAIPEENDSLITELFMSHLKKEPKIESNGNDPVEEMHNSDVSLSSALRASEMQLGECEAKLSECMSQLLTSRAESDAFRERHQVSLDQISVLTMKLEEKEAELKQFKSLVQKQVNNEEEASALKKKLAETTKELNKNKKIHANSIEALNKRVEALLKYKKAFKKIMVQFVECSEILISKNLLTAKQRKCLEDFIELYKNINPDSDDFSDDSSVSQEENATHNHSAQNTSYVTCVKKEILPDELAKSCFSHVSTSDSSVIPVTTSYSSSSNVKSSTNVEPPIHQNLPSDSKGFHCEVSRNSKSPIFQLPFSSTEIKIENSSNGGMQKNKITSNNATHSTVYSRSSDVEIINDSINLKDIMGSMVLEVDHLNLISPIPESPLKKFYSHSDKIRSKENDLHTQALYKNCSVVSKDISSIHSSECKKNRLSHQTSSGFEPHVKEKSESIDSSTNNEALIVENPFQAPISSNLHYLSSAYTNNTFQVLHQGSSALDYIANPDTKFTAFVLTIPKRLPKNSIHNNKDDIVLPCVEERMSSVQSLYNAAINSKTSVNRGILNSWEKKTENSATDPFSYVYVQVDSKKGQINLTSNLQNISTSNKHGNSCLTIDGRENEEVNLSSNCVSNKNNIPCLSADKPDIVNNQPFASDSCNISPHKRKIDKILHHHSTNKNKLNISENKDNLPMADKAVGNLSESSQSNEMNKPKYSLPENHPHLLSYPKSNQNENIELEKSLDRNFTKQFSIFDDENALKNTYNETAEEVLESSENETISVVNACKSNSRAVTSEKAIAIFHTDKSLDQTISFPDISAGKNKSEDGIYSVATCRNLQDGSPPVENKATLNACNLNNEADLSESAFETCRTKDKIATSTPKCISVNKNNSEDEMYFAVTYDNNLQSKLPHVKQKLFQDEDFKSHSLQSHENKSSNTFDNSEKSVVKLSPYKEINDTVAENKGKLHIFSDLSTENVSSDDVELPASKKRKLVKSPLKLCDKKKSIPSLSDESPDCVKTISESSLKIMENFQSSVHVINRSSVDKSFGVFMNDNNNLGNHCDEERNTTLNIINSIDLPKNIEKDTRPTGPKSPNVSANKDTNDGTLNKSNLCNVSKKRKTKNRNKRQKKENLSSTIEICPKIPCPSEISQPCTSFISGLQNDLKIPSFNKELLQKDSKNSSHNILEQKELKSNLNYPCLKNNDAINFKTNSQANSDAKVSIENTCNIPKLENTILKRKEKIMHHKSFNVQAVIHSNKISEDKEETLALNIDQEKFIDKDNLSIEKCSDNQEIRIEQNSKIDSSPVDFKTNAEINYCKKVIHANSCSIPSLENTVTETKEEGTHCESFKVQALAHSSKSLEEKNDTYALNIDREKITNNSLDINALINNQLKMVEENYKANPSNNLPSDDLLDHKELCNPSSSHAIASESITTEIKKDLCLQDDDINLTPVNDTFSEQHDKVSFHNTVEKVDPPDDLQDENKKIHTRRNSSQSSISDDENPLVIADDDYNPIAETASNIVNNKAEAVTTEPEHFNNRSDNEVDSASETEKLVKRKKKKRKNSKTSKANKRKKSQSCEEDSIYNSCTIEKALDDIKKMKFEEMLTNHSNYKLLLHKLISALINPANAPNTTSALYQVFSFLSLSKLNPLVSYPIKKNTSVFSPPSENCIVEALVKTESKKKIHLQGLIQAAISTLYYLILDKKSITKTGLGALCRIFTQLCKITKNKHEPIRLTCDLIKEQHPLAPVLVAFIIGTWVELFEPTKESDVFRLLLLSSIYFGLQKKPPTITSADWNACKVVFSLPSLDPLPTDLDETTDILINSVTTLVTGPPSEKDEWACDQILIFAVANGWAWTEEKLISCFISSLNLYAKNVCNERAFSLFAQLCADIGKQAPDGCYTILEALSSLLLEDCEFAYVRKHAAQSLLKLILFKRLPVPDMLTQIIQENENNLDSSVELYLRRRCIADEKELTENDILIS